MPLVKILEILFPQDWWHVDEVQTSAAKAQAFAPGLWWGEKEAVPKSRGMAIIYIGMQTII